MSENIPYECNYAARMIRHRMIESVEMITEAEIAELVHRAYGPYTEMLKRDVAHMKNKLQQQAEGIKMLLEEESSERR